MIELTRREEQVLDSIPYDAWINQLQLATSKPVLTKLCNAKLIKRKSVHNPSGDPRKGMGTSD